MNKIFILGLPRSGTTSLCAAMLDFDLTVAHTAFTKRAFELAQVVADTPVFNDFPQLDALFSDSRYIYLKRDLDAWLPSMEKLIDKLNHQFGMKGERAHPLLLRCYQESFGLFKNSDVSRDQLVQRYREHEIRVLDFFKQRSADFLQIQLSDTDLLLQVSEFLNLDLKNEPEYVQMTGGKGVIPVYNASGKITDWKKIKHQNKVDSYAFGDERRKYFDY